MLKVRTAVMNGTFERDHNALGQSIRRRQSQVAYHPKFETVSGNNVIGWFMCGEKGVLKIA